MNVRIIHYTASTSPLVEAFIDIELYGWLRFNGLNLLRDGTLRSSQLTPWRSGKRWFRNAIEILASDRAKLLAAEILSAIQAYRATLPATERWRPPAPPKGGG